MLIVAVFEDVRDGERIWMDDGRIEVVERTEPTVSTFESPIRLREGRS
jgi:pyruvate kinase